MASNCPRRRPSAWPASPPGSPTHRAPTPGARPSPTLDAIESQFGRSTHISTQALFIQGAGQGAHAADGRLVASLGQLLGPEFDIHYPVMPHEDDADYEIWKVQIASELTAVNDPVLLLGHSMGASILLKYLSESEVERTIAGIFLIATPFWGGD